MSRIHNYYKHYKHEGKDLEHFIKWVDDTKGFQKFSEVQNKSRLASGNRLKSSKYHVPSNVTAIQNMFERRPKELTDNVSKV